MVLTVDIGNSNIVVGAYVNDTLAFVSRISTDTKHTSDEYAVMLRDVIAIYKHDCREISGAIISSVVPPLSPIIKKAIAAISDGIEPLIVGPGIKTGLNIRIDNPAQLGADFVCASVAAKFKYPLPSVVVDFGTATKFSALDEEGSFCGGSIMPGIMISMNALVSGTAQLPSIDLNNPPRSVIGTNTVDCMRSGVIYGNASMTDGMIERYKEQLGNNLTVIATGGLASAIVPYCNSDMIYNRNLILLGLKRIYDLNN